METPHIENSMFILYIILIIIGLVSILIGIILPLVFNEPWYILCILASIAFIVPGFVGLEYCDHPIPREKDVLDGKAIYQETIHITDNDTIKTYKIIWKNEN